jgi:hypothetical protein
MLRKVIVGLLLLSGLILTACSGSIDKVFASQVPASSPIGGEQTRDGQFESVAPTGGEAQTDQQGAVPVAAANTTYTIVDTGLGRCYDNSQEIPCPSEGEAFYGQDAQYAGTQAAYQDNGDGTVTDLNTGLMWTQNYYGKMTWEEALASDDSFTLARYDDWRLPTIKELYSLIDFNGSSFQQIPYIDTDYFDFRFGDSSLGERTIDAQYWSSTEYVSTTMNGTHTVFGVNFADGRIKGYGTSMGPRVMTQFVRYVRDNSTYGVNDFVDNGDSTITDRATGLTWMQTDSGTTLNWEQALSYCEDLSYAGNDDWRLPNAKELQSIVDYSRAPTVTNSAAIDPIFDVTEIESWFWSGTTHLDGPSGDQAVYVAFGRAFGLPNGTLTDVHGAGAQRSDPKSGDPANYASGRGTQGQDDQVRIYNYARCVRNGAQFVPVTGSPTGQTAGQQLPGEQTLPDGNQQAPGGQLPGGGTGQPPTGGQSQGPGGPPPQGGQPPQ